MRLTLFVFCCLFGLSASAQWYRLDRKLKKQPARVPLQLQLSDHAMTRLSLPLVLNKTKVQMLHLDRSDYSLEAAEAIVMRTAQHNMRFRIYSDASYNFSELASLYVQQNRFSEAKWYLLQSNNISRGQNDNRHTISNLIGLATIKAELGDFTQALQDLAEAREMAISGGYRDDLIQVEKKTLYIKQNRLSYPKPELRYAEAAENNNKAG